MRPPFFNKVIVTLLPKQTGYGMLNKQKTLSRAYIVTTTMVREHANTA